ncbi:MAG: bifunctional pyr operon transcriptional regulator/uracil phosphoribosyltransferase PyrR [Oscillospiraceae bacterium]|nr:bifunctional pyr operon transcriptional regulator/uracil phosphoribosyltransferase PyrR [Oscillospiraceae bacterium]
MEFKAKIMDEAAIQRSMARITHEIIEKNRGAEGICLLGVKRRGIPLAKMLHDNIKKFEGIDVPVGHIDITLYRDDLTAPIEVPETDGCEIPCNVSDYTIIIVDDVLYTGRTVRAAIESIFRLGRPKSIQLAVLIDRGHRELPIRPDFVGKNIPTSKTELVSVLIDEVDGETGVCLYNM